MLGSILCSKLFCLASKSVVTVPVDDHPLALRFSLQPIVCLHANFAEVLPSNTYQMRVTRLDS